MRYRGLIRFPVHYAHLAEDKPKARRKHETEPEPLTACGVILYVVLVVLGMLAVWAAFIR